jgi:hypothetical protein
MVHGERLPADILFLRSRWSPLLEELRDGSGRLVFCVANTGSIAKIGLSLVPVSTVAAGRLRRTHRGFPNSAIPTTRAWPVCGQWAFLFMGRDA